ncbi:hypothetical protein [Streptomyces huiliensis]|uniref:hypothetical protein n=1 Tax=Streptomyces huiliensis TaxID=2876027 RepID=UPI001CC135BB|nr:hypothetical protein [Streptomyces huiliensis]
MTRAVPLRREEPADEAFGVRGDEGARRAAEAVGQGAGPVPLQQGEHPLRPGRRDDGQGAGVPLPPVGVPGAPGPFGEVPLGLVEEGARVAAGQTDR